MHPIRPATLPLPFRRLWAPILGLGLTQLIGWGASFTALTVLGTPISRDLHMSHAEVFGGITVMLIVSALLAPRLGRRIDSEGARSLMVQGTLAGAVALLVIGVAQGPGSYWLGWAIFGVAVAMMLTNAAVPALVQIAGPDARRAVTTYTIITGVTSAVFLPLTAWLESAAGWRSTLLLYGLSFLVICLPIHLAVLPRTRPQRTDAHSGRADVSWEGQLPERWRRAGFWLIATWMATQGLIVWGFNIQAVDILLGVGLPSSAVIGVWMLSGPAQAAARLVELASGGRSGVLAMALLAATMAPIGFYLVLFGGVSVTTTTILAVCYGIGQGLYAVARNLVPLRLFGMKTFGATMGQLTLPLNLCSASAPLLFSLLIERAGAPAALWAAAFAGSVSCLAILMLHRVVRSAGAA